MTASGRMAVVGTLAAACATLFVALAAAEETRPQPRPASWAEGISPVTAAAKAADPQPARAEPAQDPNRGSVTNLPIPRYVSLKTGEGNARRGPGRTHRIDWVFTRAGMPLRITAEFEHWRRVEDADGVGGWIHYSLLSGMRSALVMQDMAEFRTLPDPDAPVALQAEMGVIARILACEGMWCRLSVEGQRGWVLRTALWGVDADEQIE